MADGEENIQQQRQSFEAELCRVTGEEALAVWDRYIKWTLQTFPQGGKRSNLNALLERSVMQFANDKKYFDDARYVNLWIKLAQNSSSPGEMYGYMEAQGVGLTQAAFYLAWAQELERLGNFQKAESVLQEGSRVNTQPPGKLQHYYRTFQARVSKEANRVQEEDEPPSPPRTNMVDLRPRGRARAAAPISRAEASGAGYSRGRSLELPRSTQNNPSIPMVVFDENQAGLSMEAEPSQPLPEVQKPQKPGSSPSLQPDQTLSGSVCRNKLSVQQPVNKEAGHGEEGGAKEQSMYCKDLLTNGIIEFSFEELRAQRHFSRKRQEYDEKIKQMSEEKHQLRQQLEEKQRLLLLRKPLVGQDGPVGETLRGRPSGLGRPQGATPFHIYNESQSDSASAMPSGNPQPPDEMSDDVFLRPEEKGLSLKVQFPRQGGAAASELSLPSKSFPERSESLAEEAIVSGHQNKTVCSSPDNTRDFAGAAKMASTPHSGLPGQRASSPNTDCQGGLTEDLQALVESRLPTVTPKPGVESQNKLSPIQEASVEAGSSSTSIPASLSSLGGHSARNPSSLEENQEVMDHAPSPTEDPVDPCSLEARRQLLDHMDLSSFPELHSELRHLPTMEEDLLLLGGEVFLIHSKVTDGERFSIYIGTFQQYDVVIKVETSLLPWDFYQCCRLKQKQPAGQLPQISCFLFLDGCVTVYTAPLQHTLSELRESQIHELSVVWSVVCLLQFVRNLHSCRMLHGALQPDTLIHTHSESRMVDGVFPVDWSSSVDLELQKEVTSVQLLPSAWRYISLGLLEPMAPPYLVDLVGVAETTHLLLTQTRMVLVKDDAGWTVETFSQDKPGGRRVARWRNFFRTALNPGGRSSLSVLSDLLDLMS